MGYSDPERQREYQAGHQRRKREEWLTKNSSCKICGSNRNVKLFSYKMKIPHNVWSMAKERREEVLRDCVPLCATHHRIESLRRFKERSSAQEVQQAVRFDPSDLQVEGKEVVITVTIKVV